jgi:hypothetical protein
MRYQAMLAAVNAGSLPASVLEEQDDVEPAELDDERTGTKYNYSWFHIIFAIAAMYVAGLLTDWAIISTTPINPGDVLHDEQDVFIGRSEATMWMRIMSAWVCYGIYAWSL